MGVRLPLGPLCEKRDQASDEGSSELGWGKANRGRGAAKGAKKDRQGHAARGSRDGLGPSVRSVLLSTTWSHREEGKPWAASKGLGKEGVGGQPD